MDMVYLRYLLKLAGIEEYTGMVSEKGKLFWINKRWENIYLFDIEV